LTDLPVGEIHPFRLLMVGNTISKYNVRLPDGYLVSIAFDAEEVLDQPLFPVLQVENHSLATVTNHSLPPLL